MVLVDFGIFWVMGYGFWVLGFGLWVGKRGFGFTICFFVFFVYVFLFRYCCGRGVGGLGIGKLGIGEMRNLQMLLKSGESRWCRFWEVFVLFWGW